MRRPDGRRTAHGFGGLLAAALTILFAAAPALAGDEPYGKGLLWRIERAGDAPSHVFGTIHMTDSRVSNLPPPVRDAFNRSQSLTVEVTSTPDMGVKVARMMVLPKGRRLSDIVGRRLFEAAVEAAQPFGVNGQVLDRLKPWAAFVSFSLPKAERMRRAQGAVPLDHMLQARAQALGRPVHSLETVEEQLGAFDRLSTRDQIALLRHAVRDSGNLNEISETILHYYLDRDIGGLLDWMAKSTAGDDPRLLKVYETSLLKVRNRVMADRLARRLAEGNAFIAVGAAHLPGKDGVLSLLAARGYKISRVY